MSYNAFYRYIVQVDDKYMIMKGNQSYGKYNTLADALYERDRLIAVDWDWDLSVELPETINGYIHITLPPFNHQPSYISEESEHWVVRGKGTKQKYYGTYNSEEEAKRVALIYNANINYRPPRWSVKKKHNGREKFYGRYKTREEAEARVKFLMENNWET